MPNIREIIDMIKKKIQKISFGRKKKEEEIDEEDEESFDYDEENLMIEEEDVETETEDEETVAVDEEILAKIEELESKFPKLETMITNLRKENESLRDNLDRINENFHDIMALYEVVSNQINPFIGASKITTASIERLEKLEYETEILKKKIEDLQKDIIFLADIYIKQHYDTDINEIIEKIIEDVITEEEISKAISKEEETYD